MEYAIFPMKTISISNRYSDAHKAWDLNGDSPTFGERTEWYAPCTVRVNQVSHYTGKPTSYRNTVIFGSCDKDGNEAKVMCEDGVARVLTFACTHMDEEPFNAMYSYTGNTGKYKVGDVIPSGTPCYSEGFTGLDINIEGHGYHVHMEVGMGWQYKESGSYLPNLLDENKKPLIPNVFYQLSGFNHDGNQGSNGYTFKTVSSRTYSDEPIPPTNSTGVYLQGVLGGFNVRPNSNGTGIPLVTVPVGSKATILEFMPGFISASDGNSYQWAKVKYGNYIGYAQLDLHQDYKIVCDSTFNPVYLRAVGSYFNIRAEKNKTSTILGTVAVGSRIKLIAISSTHEAGGYQWARVDYNGQVGFVEIDTVGFNQLEF